MLRDCTGEEGGEWVYIPSTFTSKGIKLIDFGCAIDCEMYAPGTGDEPLKPDTTRQFSRNPSPEHR